MWVRLFHWALALAVTFLLISGETGLGFFDWHRLAGEVVFILIVFRILWGIVGSSNARLATLPGKPLHALKHFRALFLRDVTQERGHNAAGGWAVLLMLLLLTIQATTGMFIADEEEWVEGAFYGVFSQANSDYLYNIHHMNAEFLKIVVIVHTLMIAVYYLYAKQNLIKPMITGSMNWISKSQVPEVQFGKFSTGLIVAIVVTCAVALGVGWIKLKF